MLHDKSNKINIKLNYVKDMLRRGALKLHYMETNEHIVDVLMKTIEGLKFEYFKKILGVIQNENS